MWIGWKSILILALFVSSENVFVFGQEKKRAVFLQKAKEYELCHDLLIDSTGIQPVSRNPNDTIVTEISTGTVIQSFPNATESFWQKIYVLQDCEITFAIHPTDSHNVYNFFLYKSCEDFSPEEIKEKKIAPLRANLCKNEMAKEGTGLSIASAINFYDASSKTPVKDFYYTYYHIPVQAKKGEVYLLNVYHIQGTDCGYVLTMGASSMEKKLKMFYDSCYTKKIADIKIQRKVNWLSGNKKSETISSHKTTEAIQKKTKPIVYRAVFTAVDSLTGKNVEMEIILKKPKAGVFIINSENGKKEVTLMKNTAYDLVFHAVGYKEKNFRFKTTDHLQSFSETIRMIPFAEGENFVMDKIYFYPNSSKIKPGSKKELDKLFQYLKENPKVCIEIQGHTNGNKWIKKSYGTDFTGSSKKLSQVRADMIKQYLVEKGIAPDRLTAVGYGGSKMIYPKPATQREANKNIRVEVLLVPPKVNSFTSRR